ncbi:MAG TPA: sugar ABC transporter ATP-binding protein [Elusimicrobiota bacterium]|jgi:D-xylose transport system ATP-binding protein|nr:sugar ABC transporter ATP-binding protein [Elusimicrobiota bacterium]
MSGPLLEARGVTKRFPGVVALKDVNFDVRAGEIHALCGENGAGKSTLIKLLSGVHPAGSYEGELLVDGARAEFAGVGDAQRAGIAAIAQEMALVPALSIAENVRLGDWPQSGGLVDWEEARRDAREWLGRLGLDADPDLPVERLGAGQRQLVEIAKALRRKARVLILDEPTAALAEAEARRLMELVRALRKDGIGIVYISHRLEEIFEIADRVTVLRDGTTVSTRRGAEAGREVLIRDMVGRELGDLFPRRAPALGPVRFEARGLGAEGGGGVKRLAGVSFSVRAGEVLGIGGLMGAGRTELLMHLFGAWGRRTAGELRLEGERLAAATPWDALAAGLALVTEDRRRHGLIIDQSVGFNLSLSTLSSLMKGGLLDAHEEAVLNERDRADLRIKTPGLGARVGGLSGGNQQKVLFGRARRSAPKVLLLDEPTRGVDVGAKVEIYEVINGLTEKGLAVILVSSELPELIGMSDRIVMMRQGRVAGEFSRGEATQERLIAAALGQEAAA